MRFVLTEFVTSKVTAVNNRTFLVETNGRAHLFENFDDALEQAGAIIANWVADDCCSVVRERLQKLLADKEFRWAVHEWNRHQPEMTITIYLIGIDSRII